MPTNTKVQIVIKGLAYCQPVVRSAGNRGQLLVTFIHPDAHHKVRMTIKDKIGTNPETSRPVESIAVGDRIEFTAADMLITSSNPPGTNNADITNIFALHRRPPGFHLELRQEADINILRTHMVIPSDQFYSRAFTTLPQEYWVYNTSTNTKTSPSARKAVANEVRVDFDIPSNLAVVLRRMSDGKTYPLPSVQDITYTVELDNGCHDHSCGNDFGYYYELFNNSQNNIEMDQFTIRMPILTADPETLDAACNPIWGDPPF